MPTGWPAATPIARRRFSVICNSSLKTPTGSRRLDGAAQLLQELVVEMLHIENISIHGRLRRRGNGCQGALASGFRSLSQFTVGSCQSLMQRGRRACVLLYLIEHQYSAVCVPEIGRASCRERG